MKLRRRRPQVRVDLSETPESQARKAAEADWPQINERAQELRRLRERNEFGERFAAAFRLQERQEGRA